MFVYRKTLTEVVDELIAEFHRDEDQPFDHVCGKAGRDCTHQDRDARPLLERLAELSTPSMSMLHDSSGGKRPKGPAGSPAPWSAGAAELLDEVQRGSLELDENARLHLGFGPLHVSVPPPRRPLLPSAWPTTRVPAAELAVAVAGPPALAGLPTLWEALRAAPGKRDHWLVKGGASIDQRIRTWHRQAQLLTGHEIRWASVGQFKIERPPPRSRGPVCAVQACGHQSCRAIRATPRDRWETGRCPYCSSASLRQDPVTGNVLCLRPSCQTEAGDRHVWTVDELERLGVIILSEAKAGAA